MTLPVWAKVSLSTLIVVSWTGDFLSRIDDPTEAAGLPKLLPFGGNGSFYIKTAKSLFHGDMSASTASCMKIVNRDVCGT